MPKLRNIFPNQQIQSRNLNVTLDFIRSMASSSSIDCVGVGANVSVAADLTLSPEFLDYRSEVIATYALCGFANFSSIGIILGVLTAMAPERAADFAAVVFRAMITANFACFLSGCVAGLLSDTAESSFSGELNDSARNCSLGWT